MNLVSPAYKICVSAEPAGSRRLAYVRHTGSSVVSVDFASPQALPNGTSDLISFLDEFDEDPGIATQLPDARIDVGTAFEKLRGTSIRTLRLKMGMSQADLALALGTSQAAVSAIENRTRKPGEDSIRELSRVLNVDFNTLMEALSNA
jgi:DNA-binding transcriptional regulator YiaG